MRTKTKMIDGKEYFPSFIDGKDITTNDWLSSVADALNDHREQTFWIYGCLFVAFNPEHYGNTDNSGWFRMVYRKADSDLDAAHRKILKELSSADTMENGFFEYRVMAEIVGNDIRYSFWHREL